MAVIRGPGLLVGVAPEAGFGLCATTERRISSQFIRLLAFRQILETRSQPKKHYDLPCADFTARDPIRVTRTSSHCNEGGIRSILLPML